MSDSPTPAARHAKQPPTLWSRVLLVVGGGVVASFQIGKAPPVLPMMTEDLSLTLFWAGWVLSSFYVLGFLISPSAGALGDWLGHRRLLLAGLGSQCLGSLAGAAAPGVELLMLSRLLEGLGYVFVAVSAPGIIIGLTREADRRVAFGIWACFMPTGGALMMVAAPWLAGALGWRGLWLVNGFLALGYSVLLFWGTRGLPTHLPGRFSIPRMTKDIWRTAKSGGPVLAAVGFACFAMQFFAVIGFLPTLLIKDEGLSAGLASLMAAVVLGSNVVGNLSAGVLLKRGWPRWRLMTITLVVMGVCSLGIYSPLLGIVPRYLLCVIFSAVGGLLPVAVIEGATFSAPEPGLVATSTGLVMQGAQGGLLIGPPLLALVVGLPGGWQNAPWLLVSASLIGILVGALGFRRVENRIRQASAASVK